MIYNWCDENSLTQAQPIKSEYQQLLQGRFNILFAGNMGKAQSLDTILDVSTELRSESKIQFVFVGGGTETERLKQRVLDENIENIVFIPRMPMSEIGGVLEHADVLLVHLKRDPLFEITVPSKTQAYMAMGKPTLSTPLEANVKINRNNSNLFATNIDEWVECINKYISNRSFYREVGFKNQKIVEEYYSVEANSISYINIFNQLINVRN